MKKVILLLFVLFVVGCQGPKQLVGDCKPDPEAVLKAVTPLLIQEGFEIKTSDAKIGYLNAETVANVNYLVGGASKKVWFVSVQNGRIVASAKIVTTAQNAFGATTGVVETYFDDETEQGEMWYWTVRSALEKVCENTLIINHVKK